MLKSTLKDVPKRTKSAPKQFFRSFVVVLYSILIFFAITSQNDRQTVVLNGRNINVEIATTSQEKKIGLCCRERLHENAGMLFVYDQPGNYSFWMKDTLIALDIVWIDSVKKIVHIEKDVQPSSFPKSYSSPIKAQYVLETNAGWVQKNAVQIGDRAIF